MTKRAKYKRKPKKQRPAAVCYAQVRTLMWLRYPDFQIADDQLDRNRLRALLEYAVQRGSDIKELRGIAANWTSWMQSSERDCLLTTWLSNRQRWDGFQLGMLFNLTLEERTKHKITVAWPAGFTPQDRKKHRRTLRKKYEKNRRRRISAEQREASRAAYDEPCLSDHQKAVYAQTSPTWKSSSQIEKELSTWRLFKHHNNVALRQVISRALRALEKLGLVERDDTQKGSRKQPLVYVRRATASPSPRCPRPDVTVTTVTSLNRFQDAE